MKGRFMLTISNVDWRIMIMTFLLVSSRKKPLKHSSFIYFTKQCMNIFFCFNYCHNRYFYPALEDLRIFLTQRGFPLVLPVPTVVSALLVGNGSLHTLISSATPVTLCCKLNELASGRRNGANTQADVCLASMQQSESLESGFFVVCSGRGIRGLVMLNYSTGCLSAGWYPGFGEGFVRLTVSVEFF